MLSKITISARPSRPRSRPRRGGGGGRNDSVLPLVTGILGTGIIAYALYVFTRKPAEPVKAERKPPCRPVLSCKSPVTPITPVAPVERIKDCKRKWLSELEEQAIREQNLRRELTDHMQKVKEITERLRHECALKEKLKRQCETAKQRKCNC